MTEKEIINDLECCVNNKCKECSRYDIIDGCERLKKDAIAIMKMQADAGKLCTEENVRLVKENERLGKALNHNYTKTELIKAVNDIIEACCEDNTCYDCGGSFSLDNQVETIKCFIRLIGEESCSIVIRYNDAYPKIQYEE